MKDMNIVPKLGNYKSFTQDIKCSLKMAANHNVCSARFSNENVVVYVTKKVQSPNQRLHRSCAASLLCWNLIFIPTVKTVSERFSALHGVVQKSEAWNKKKKEKRKE